MLLSEKRRNVEKSKEEAGSLREQKHFRSKIQDLIIEI